MSSQIPSSRKSAGGIFCCFLWACVVLISSSQAQDGTVSASGKYMSSPAPSTNTMTAAAALEKLKQTLNIEKIDADTFRVGQVLLNRRERTVRIPCRVNMRRYAVEYVLVTETGKRHESVLITEARAEQVHIACLLLGVTATNMPVDYKQPVQIGPRNGVEITASWEKDGASTTCGLDKLVVMRAETAGANEPKTDTGPKNKPLSPGKWFYNGSFFGPTAFQAQVEGSIVSLIRDPAALINNPRDDLDNDKIHYPNDQILPAEGTAVAVLLKF